jgi:SPP1 gp7 family putative phage head morphogenesis protein
MIFAPQPHEEAIGLIKGKPVATRRVFDGLLPELRGRVFTVTGIEAANTMQRLRDAIAELPAGSTWAEVKEKMLPDISPYFGEDPEGADRRAELLIRTHGFQAFQAANWRTAQADEDTTHLQYLATEDTHVRESHLALNGLILPKDDPFWQKHLPPWDWGCRCRVRPMNPDLVDMEREADEKRNPDDKLVLEGPALRKLREGTLIRDGQVFDVTPPSESNREGEGTKNAYEWHPDNLALSAKELEERYEPEVWAVFRKFAEKESLRTAAGDEVTVWEWLNGGERGEGRGEIGKPAPKSPEPPKAVPPDEGQTLEGMLEALGMNQGKVTAEHARRLWEEMAEENPVTADELKIVFRGRKSGTLSEKNIRQNFQELLSRLPRKVVEALPAIEVEVANCDGALGEYSYVNKRLRLAPKLAKMPDQARSTLFHEMMHWVHIHGPKEYADAIRTHFEARTAGEKLDVLPGYSRAKGKLDRWYEAYAGRVYGMPVEQTHMGLEVPTRYVQILAMKPEEVAAYWNDPAQRETMRVVLGIFFPSQGTI